MPLLRLGKAENFLEMKTKVEGEGIVEEAGKLL
jgi:hypothetical protein